MTKAMPFLQKVILLSYDPRPLESGGFFAAYFAIQSRLLSVTKLGTL